jgi:type IV pilus biogenesis protein CpaD/CtpE
MNLQRSIACVIVAALSSACAAQRPPQTDLSNFTFTYQLPEGDRFGVTQVFDDGKRTYFAIGTPAVVPIVTVGPAGEEIVAAAQLRAPYLVVDGIARRFVLRDGARRAEFTFTGQRLASDVRSAAEADLTPAIPGAAPSRELIAQERAEAERARRAAEHRPTFGSVQPVFGDTPASRPTLDRDEIHVPFKRGMHALERSAASTVRGAVGNASDIQAAVIVARQDDGEADGLSQKRAATLRSALIEHGVAASRIVVREGFKLFDDSASIPTSQVVFVRRTTGPAVAATASDDQRPKVTPPAAAAVGAAPSATPPSLSGRPGPAPAQHVLRIAQGAALVDALQAALMPHGITVFVSPDDALVGMKAPAELRGAGPTVLAAIDALLRQMQAAGSFLDAEQKSLGISRVGSPTALPQSQRSS